MREPQTIADPEIYLPAIDGLRGIAVLMVLAVHTSQRVGNVGLEMFRFPLIGEFIDAGARGVELFFLLSAFTLFRSSRAKYSEESNPRRNFYIRREISDPPPLVAGGHSVCVMGRAKSCREFTQLSAVLRVYSLYSRH